VKYLEEKYGYKVTHFLCGEDRYNGYKRQIKDDIDIIMIPRDVES